MDIVFRQVNMNQPLVDVGVADGSNARIKPKLDTTGVEVIEGNGRVLIGRKPGPFGHGDRGNRSHGRTQTDLHRPGRPATG